MSERATLSVTDIVRRAPFVIETELDGEIILLHPETGECYALNAIATRIWTALAEPGSVRSICSALIERYDVDRATCEAQVLALLEQLRGEGVIQRSEAPGI